MDYWLHILVLVGIYAALANSLDLMAGHTGLLSVAHAAFFGVGAYAAAISSTYATLGFLGSTFTACAVVGLLALVVGSFLVRFLGDLFVLVTFALQVVVSDVFRNWTDVTNGAIGIRGIPDAKIAGWVFTSAAAYALLAALLALGAYLVVNQISASPLGRVLRAVREDAQFVESLGKNPFAQRLIVFVIGAVVAGASGSLYAHYVSYIDPTSFTLSDSILILSMVIVGGPGSRSGPMIGAAVLVSLPEILRFVGVSGATAAHTRHVFYGALLVGMMLWRPRGLVGQFLFGAARDD